MKHSLLYCLPRASTFSARRRTNCIMFQFIYTFGVAAINKIIAQAALMESDLPCSLSMQRGWLKVATCYLTSLDWAVRMQCQPWLYNIANCNAWYAIFIYCCKQIPGGQRVASVYLYLQRYSKHSSEKLFCFFFLPVNFNFLKLWGVTWHVWKL